MILGGLVELENLIKKFPTRK